MKVKESSSYNEFVDNSSNKAGTVMFCFEKSLEEHAGDQRPNFNFKIFD